MADNAITLENARTDGVTAKSYWDVPHSTQIEGFTTDFSVNAGDQIDFKINVNGGAGSDYLVEVFRLGYYGGAGARKVAEWVNSDATVQPDAAYDAERALVDAGNWSVTDSWLTPTDAVSGVYLARVQRLDNNGDPIDGAANQIPFILREDDRPADVVLQTSDTTWHAYNGWFGNNGQIGANFYGDASGEIETPRAYAVSYNRPFITRGIEGSQGGPAAGAQDYLFGADYAAIQWLEQNGYDVSYISGVDTDRLGADYLKKYDAYISVGHDEYWSGDQRSNVEEARDSGVNLLFWSGNEVYWKTRYETSIVDGVEYRTLVCYKETWANQSGNNPEDYYNLDPANEWTGTWRDVRFVENPLAGGDNEPENSLTGQLFGPDGTGEFGGALDVPEEYSGLRVWRDTSIANGGALDIAEGIIGYEWNVVLDDEYTPDGLIKLSETTLPWSGILVDEGNTVAPGVETHNLSLYRAESGALVFGAGTVFWSWALSDVHDGEPYIANIENTDLQQFVVNLFADMGIQPAVADAVLASQGLVRATASNDGVAATATIDDLPADVSALSTVTITGTATDDDGNAATEDGVVALVEVSFDGGQTWRTAQGTTNWSYSWVPTTEGDFDILVRAIDDSLNMPNLTGLDSELVTVTAPVIPSSVSLFEPFTAFNGGMNAEGTSYELGMRFTANQAGEVTQLRYYRAEGDSGDTDVREGHLWDSNGQLLATVTFTSTPGETGWQLATLDTPISLQVGQEYTVSYRTDDNYVSSQGFFSTSYTEPYGILSAPGGINGVYAFASGSGAVYPQQTYNTENYWVDVTFAVGDVVNVPPIITSPSSFSMVENTAVAGQVTATDSNGNLLTYAIAGGDDAGLFVINASTGVLSFASAPDYEAPGDANGDNAYEVTVSVSDGIDPAVTQALVVNVTDLDESGGATVSLFGPSTQPTGTVFNDFVTYELGTRFEATVSGEISGLRYYRGTGDSGDTDTRTLNLWSDTGTLLASVAVTSLPGQSGWQTGALTSSVGLVAGQTYVVSYGTTGNYVADAGFFSTAHASADGSLIAPASGGGEANGVFAQGGVGIFPTGTWNASNYWTDVEFTPGVVTNDAPAFTLASTDVTVNENQTGALTLTASDPDGDTLTYAIAGGVDASAFVINATTGVLRFASAPDFEAPADANGNNAYEVTVSVSDGVNPAVTQALVVNVADIDETIPNDPPTFTLASTTVTVDENQTGALTLTASDPDGDALTYAIAGGADEFQFVINPNTGLLTFASAPDYEAPADANGDNAYELLVAVSDGINPAVEQSLLINVADVDEAIAGGWSLFGPTAVPDAIVTYDPTDYELGVEFTSAAAGQVTSLRYYRGAADATDTDVRTLNLWDAAGNKLASVVVQSDPGESGWQSGILSAPVEIAADEIYVVSYGTTQNYAFTGNFFDTDWTGPDGNLTAPSSGGNGVFSAGSTGDFPTQSYNASNYWVDLTVDPLAIV
ncbi:DUF4082 domain-containing protein [Tropicimonas isoalkanivorans]|uniref:Cadherin domain-containing protein n=1 Tax=Tropicimonas isoalkanivorans TaxID=441112 RepID=A0A1I1LKP4_9RHOB|nr:DUF4082 domain-containing protein [Tropicimonas isoalkanivorans]SFC73601.1 Cadherin domain-containing protein [Tropicimonas isoalkanivorans]